MRQRTAIARTLAYAPRILMMDEPFGALDEQTRLLLGDTVLRIQQELGQTILLITHSIAESVQLSDRVLVMTYRPGRLKRFVDIDLPRPRSSEDVGDPRFGRLVAEIWGDLREEATRGLRESESMGSVRMSARQSKGKKEGRVHRRRVPASSDNGRARRNPQARRWPERVLGHQHCRLG